MDYLEALKKIYKPEFGSIWKAPNNIWTNSFAKNKAQDGIHPAIVERIKQDNVSVQLAPGTSKDYKKGSCVFKVDLREDGEYSYFLLKLSMPFLIDELFDLGRGWNGIETLNGKQLDNFKLQIRFCKG